MVSLSEQSVIPAPLDDVWPLLRDPEVVASCIPGAELAPSTGDGMWRGAIKVKFGPTVAAFRGEANLSFDDEAKTCSIEGRGIDQRGASRALASGKVKASGDQETQLDIDGEFNVTGPLETFANAGGVHVARALLAEFSTNLANLVAERGGGGAPTEDAAPPAEAAAPSADDATAAPPAAAQPAAPPTPRAAKEINGFGLLWQVLKTMLGRLVGKKG